LFSFQSEHHKLVTKKHTKKGLFLSLKSTIVRVKRRDGLVSFKERLESEFLEILDPPTHQHTTTIVTSCSWDMNRFLGPLGMGSALHLFFFFFLIVVFLESTVQLLMNSETVNTSVLIVSEITEGGSLDSKTVLSLFVDLGGGGGVGLHSLSI